MGKDLVAEFMENSKEKDTRSIKGKNVLIVKTNKLYRNVTDLTTSATSRGFIMFICDGVKTKTNAEVIITEVA